MQLVADKAAIKKYVRLKNLLKSKQNAQAIAFFDDQNMAENWQVHMHYAMIRKNCPVTALLIDQVYLKVSFPSEEAFNVEVTKLLHDISVDFAIRVQKYLQEGKYQKEFEKYQDLGRLVYARLRTNTGHGVTNLKHQHFDNSYLAATTAD